jgi:hypothetical protein
MKSFKVLFTLIAVLFLNSNSFATSTSTGTDICFEASLISVQAFRAKTHNKAQPSLDSSSDLLESAINKLASDYGYKKANSTYDAMQTINQKCLSMFGIKK